MGYYLKFSNCYTLILVDKFNKKSIHARIIKGSRNHMPPVNSNHGGSLPNWKAEKLEKKGFKMPPLLSSFRIGAIYIICLKTV